MANERDAYGRRIFQSENAAFRAQKALMLSHGIATGVVRRSDGQYVLLRDSAVVH